MDFDRFDVRHYPTLSVTDGYAEWAATYEAVVQDEMDLRLLERVTTVAWPEVRRALDLACGTGRIGRWLRARGVGEVDGVDLTPEMLARAHAKEAYDRLLLGDLRATGLPPATYDLVTVVLADEHLGELPPLYREAARLSRSGGRFVIVGYHPHFLMQGIPTHFDRADGEPVAIESHVHLLSDHVKAAHASGWALLEMDEGVVDDAWLEKKPKWRRYASQPVSFAMVWRLAQPAGGDRSGG
jgi:SAM-dependent methyltransferase